MGGLGEEKRRLRDKYQDLQPFKPLSGCRTTERVNNYKTPLAVTNPDGGFVSATPPGIQVGIVNAPELPVSNKTTNVAFKEV